MGLKERRHWETEVLRRPRQGSERRDFVLAPPDLVRHRPTGPIEAAGLLTLARVSPPVQKGHAGPF